MSSPGRFSAFIVAILLPLSSHAMSLDEWMRKVRDHYPVLQAIETEKKAAVLKQEEGDLQELAPILTVSGQLLDDRRPQLNPDFSGERTRNDSYTLGLSKRFTTGTTASLSYAQQRTEITGASLSYPNDWSGSFGLSITQSLWQNAFGRATVLRRSREEMTTDATQLARELEARQLLLRAEQAYWQWARAAGERAIRKQELASAKRLIDWAQDRVRKQIADRSDLLQAQALLASTELQVIGAEDEYVAALKQLDQFVPGISAQDISVPQVLLQAAEAAKPHPFPRSEDVVRLDALVLDAQSKVASTAAEEVSERIKPDLSLFASYNTNSLEPGFSESVSSSFRLGRPTAAVGLRLTVNLDQPGKSDVRSGYRADADALVVRAQNSRREGEIAWSELVRRHGELRKRIEVAEKLVEVQEAKLKREGSLLQLGRSSTFQVITFEREVTVSRLALLQLLVEKRNVEAQSRLFIEKNWQKKSPEGL